MEIAVYVGLAMHAETQTGQCFPAVATLAKYVHTSENPVRAALKVLAATGYITYTPTKGGKANTYWLNPLPEIANPSDSEGFSESNPSDRGSEPFTRRGVNPSESEEEREPVTRRERANRFQNDGLARLLPPEQKHSCDECANSWVERRDGSVELCKNA
jgi:DNA-binding transcriptional MocR family regulator